MHSLQTYRPSLIQTLAILISLMVKITCAALCSRAFVFWLDPPLFGNDSAGSLLHSSISLRCFLSAGLKVKGMCWTNMEHTHLVMVASCAIPSTNMNSTPVSCSQVTTSFSLKSTVKLPFLSLLISRMVVSLKGGGGGQVSD
jgi:hypothetical protein